MFTEDEAMEAWRRSGAVGHGVAGMQAAMVYAAEVLAARRGTLTADDIQDIDSPHGYPNWAILWPQLREHIAALGARNAVLAKFAATAHGPEAWDGLQAKCSALETREKAAHESASTWSKMYEAAAQNTAQLHQRISDLVRDVLDARAERDAAREDLMAARSRAGADAEQGRAVARIATKYGWNGVDNAKVLEAFIESELEELERRRNPRCPREECARERAQVDALERDAQDRHARHIAEMDRARADIARLEAERDAIGCTQHCRHDAPCLRCQRDAAQAGFRKAEKRADNAEDACDVYAASEDEALRAQETIGMKPVRPSAAIAILTKERDAAHQRLAAMRDLIMKMGQLNVDMAKAVGEPGKTPTGQTASRRLCRCACCCRTYVTAGYRPDEERAECTCKQYGEPEETP